MIIGTLVGTQAISERFLSKLHLINIDFPDKEDLSVIVVAYLSAIIRAFFPSANFSKPKVVKLAITMITIFNKIRDTPELHRQGFGSINPHDLVGWCNHLQFYSTLQSEHFEVYILEAMCYEALKIFSDRLARVEQKQTLLNILNDSIKADWDLENIADQASRH
uniref:Dynein 2 heavy chain 1 cytoplasmic ATPase lid domain-containing protein n=1 Tax=Dendroctonus ponderosae TaxID=77166 RepID=A0AAR5PA25_DENPD